MASAVRFFAVWVMSIGAGDPDEATGDALGILQLKTAAATENSKIGMASQYKGQPFRSQYFAPDCHERRFFGEVCSHKVPLWKQVGVDHTKCYSGFGAGSGFVVYDQMACQEIAKTEGMCYYQYLEKHQTCMFCLDESDISMGERENWKIFKSPSCGGSQACAEWELSPMLEHEMRDTEAVWMPLNNRGYCRKACSAKFDCWFYQFQEDTNRCLLGTATIPDEEEESDRRNCKPYMYCFNKDQCHRDCSECPAPVPAPPAPPTPLFPYDPSVHDEMNGGRRRGHWTDR